MPKIRKIPSRSQITSKTVILNSLTNEHEFAMAVNYEDLTGKRKISTIQLELFFIIGCVILHFQHYIIGIAYHASQWLFLNILYQFQISTNLGVSQTHMLNGKVVGVSTTQLIQIGLISLINQKTSLKSSGKKEKEWLPQLLGIGAVRQNDMSTYYKVQLNWLMNLDIVSKKIIRSSPSLSLSLSLFSFSFLFPVLVQQVSYLTIPTW